MRTKPRKQRRHGGGTLVRSKETKEFARRVKWAQARGFTVQQIADALGVHRMGVVFAVAGKRPTPETWRPKFRQMLLDRADALADIAARLPEV